MMVVDPNGKVTENDNKRSINVDQLLLTNCGNNPSSRIYAAKSVCVCVVPKQSTNEWFGG